VQLPNALVAEFALSMPDLLALAHAPPNPTFTSMALCALAKGIQNGNSDNHGIYRQIDFKIAISFKKIPTRFTKI